ncbi:hypothetical protein [Pseudoneobacillus sp. C159]
MDIVLYVLAGTFLLGLLTYYLIRWLDRKKTIAVKKVIDDGTKEFLAHWTYEPNQIASVQPKGSALKSYRKTLPQATEVYICTDGVLIGDIIFIAWNRLAQFQRLEVYQESLLFQIEFGFGDTKQISLFFIPIPKGKEAEALAVMESLYRVVKWDY